MRTLHGTVNVANQPATYSKGLQSIGLDSTSVDYARWSMKFRTDLEFSDMGRIGEFAKHAADYYDLFHFHWASTLYPTRSDLQHLKRHKKKMLMNFWGSDCRQISLAKRMNPFIRVKMPDEGMIRDLLRFLSVFIPTAVVADFELEAYVKPFFDKTVMVPQAIVTDDYPVSASDHEKFLIVHAPTNPQIKGTEEFAQAVAKLKEEGHDFDVALVCEMPHEEAKKWYAKADLIVDSLTDGTYGLFAIECMSMGKPVMGWITDEAMTFYRNAYGDTPPVLIANPETIYDTLRGVLEGKIDLLGMLPKAAAYAREHHDYIKVAQRLKEIYELP